LLVIRELLPGPRGFRQIRSNLPGMASNLLSSRLKGLKEEGLIEEVPRTSGKAGYTLTERGRGLRETVEALVRWGGPRLPVGLGAPQAEDPRWLWVALPALLKGRHAPAFGEVALVVDGVSLWVATDERGGAALRAEGPDQTPLRVELGYADCLALFGGDAQQKAHVLSKAKQLGSAATKQAFRRWVLEF
jgi:DNA-binding HxlR family transcriptional regulator